VPLAGAAPDNHRSLCASLDRRTFLKGAALAGLAAACPLSALAPGAAQGSQARPAPGADFDAERFVAEAQFYEKLPHKKIRCKLCPRECVIDDLERGYCGVRENRDGIYYTLVHSRPCSLHADPIEKKPLFHFHPGTTAFSIATAGCNVNCKFCQNWEISQSRPEQLPGHYQPPRELARLARRRGCASIAYTYSEPVVFYEYMLDAARAGHEEDVLSVVVTGGYISKEPLQALCAEVDAIKVDLKGFSEKFYREIVNGELQPVLDALKTMRAAGVWTEIVCLVVPTLNDSEEELAGLARWVRTELGADVPLHFTRFHPQYLLRNLPPTPIATLERARDLARAERLEYVYVGNVPGHPGEHTYCPGCGEIVVRRQGFFVMERHVSGGTCAFCGRAIAGVWGD
jgi:pyruvate formate lyase activating enzyme